MQFRAACFLLALIASAPLFAKSLFWHSLDVEARLDADGWLNVTERQAIVFDGDWNGGERIFNIRPRQTLQVGTVSRIVDGQEKRLTPGTIIHVDHYDIFESTKLRWRSREESDPPFQNQEITYVIRYRIGGVLREERGSYQLDHDFAFPDRAGHIERYSLRFELDPVWRGLQSPYVLNRGRLVPGEGVVVRASLERDPAAPPPASALKSAGRLFITATKVLLYLALAMLLVAFYLEEKEFGRFGPVDPAPSLDPEWMEANVLSMKPEVVSTVMTGEAGADAVAGTLARLAREGKITTNVKMKRGLFFERPVLELEVKVPHHTFDGYEENLIRSLFFQERKTVDTETLKKHYKRSGFNPAAIIQRGLQKELDAIPEYRKSPKRNQALKTAIAPLVGFVLLIAAAFYGGTDADAAVSTLFFGGILTLVACLAALFSSDAIGRMGRRLPWIVVPVGLLCWMVHYQISGAEYFGLHRLTIVALAACAVTVVKLVLDLLRIRQTRAKVMLRRRLYAVRRLLAGELRSDHPRIRDEWFPWIIALGLGKNADRWFRTHGDVATARSSDFASSTSSSSSSSSSIGSSPSWTGGGGSFGGAGATGGWALAALSAGVASPSSSSSGRSSGGGSSSSSSSSSSSGGGGGGGW